MALDFINAKKKHMPGPRLSQYMEGLSTTEAEELHNLLEIFSLEKELLGLTS